VLDRALAGGVAFVPGHAFYSDTAGDSELRICFSSVLPTTIDDAVKRLAKALSESGSLSRRELVPIA
jgi:DNA-binding transcriptional MocR family regulator